MTINKKRIDELLKAIPGSKKASEGIIFPLYNNDYFPKEAFTDEELNGRIMGELFGDYYHLRRIFTKDEMEGLLNGEQFYLEFCSKNEIKRLRDIKGPHEYLLRVRSESIADSARAVRVFSKRRALFESSGKPWSLTHYYHSRDEYHKSYIALLQPSKQKQLKSIPSGLAYINELNALCIRSIAGDIVIVSESLEKFFYYMTIAFYGNDYGLEAVDIRDALIIAIRIISGSESLDFDIDPRGDLPSLTDKKLKTLVFWQMQFTFGHEYSHYLAGHLKKADIINFSLKGRQNNLVTYNHQLEYEADYLSIKNISHNKTEFHHICHGAFSALLFIHFIEEVNTALFSRRLSVSDTHPKASNRITELHKSLGKKSPINDEIIEEMFNAADAHLGIIDFAREHLRDDIFKYYGSFAMSNYVNKIHVDRITN